MHVAQSGYYAWLKKPEFTIRQSEDIKVKNILVKIFEASDRTYGSARLMMALRKQGYYLGRNRIMRLMRECGLKVSQKRAFKSNTNSKHTDKIAKNHL